MPSRDYGRAGEQVRAPCDSTRLDRKWLRRATEYSKGLHRTHVVFVHLCSSLLWNLLLLGLGAGLGKCRQVQASGIVSMYGWMDVWRRAHLSTGQAGPGQKKIPLKQSGHGWLHHTPLTPSKTLVPRKVIVVKVSCCNIELLGASASISASDAPPLVSWLLQTLTILSSSPYPFWLQTCLFARCRALLCRCTAKEHAYTAR